MGEFENYNIMLIGLGPHAKRIYMNLFNKFKIVPRVIVDLKSKRKEISEYLKEKNLSNIELVFEDDSERDRLELSNKLRETLKELIYEKNIKYAIISTEPKSHFAYAKFLLENNVNILMDKPITAPTEVCSNVEKAISIKEEYETLCKMYIPKKNKISFKIQCQRRFHEGYIYIKQLIKETIQQYNIPITYIDIYHNDGMWNMPNEFLDRENHPYKYGYGKLFHSGYHFQKIHIRVTEELGMKGLIFK